MNNNLKAAKANLSEAVNTDNPETLQLIYLASLAFSQIAIAEELNDIAEALADIFAVLQDSH